jgi:hypothetical protein
VAGTDHCRQRPLASLWVGALDRKRAEAAAPGVADRGGDRAAPLADFATLGEALDYAARAARGSISTTPAAR